MNNELPQNIPTTEDDVDIALRELVRSGRVLHTKDDDGRDVFTMAKTN